jgi:hypothetical protein
MYIWTYLDGAGEEIGRSPRFAVADEAEDWIGSSWPELLENGVLAVILVDQEGGKQLYRMGLGAE